MTRQPKHRFTEEEAEAAAATLTAEESAEYESLLIGGSDFSVNTRRLNELESIGYSRLKEQAHG